ncbi:MAG: hypothetical protein ACOY3Z_00800 [Thermodesulfobacteriota bacterium]
MKKMAHFATVMVGLGVLLSANVAFAAELAINGDARWRGVYHTNVSAPDTQDFNEVSLECTFAAPPDLGTVAAVDFSMTLNATIGSTIIVTVDNPICQHTGLQIVCPYGVPTGSNSMYFDGNNNAVFPATGGGTIAVSPSAIYIARASYEGTVSGNTVTFTDIPVFPPEDGGTRILTISGLGIATGAVYNASPGTNPAIMATFSATSGISLPVSPVPVAIVSERASVCDRSYLSSTPGYDPFLFAQSVNFGGSSYSALLTLDILSNGGMGVGVDKVFSGECSSTANMLSADLTMHLGDIDFSGHGYTVNLIPNTSGAAPDALWVVGNPVEVSW